MTKAVGFFLVAASLFGCAAQVGDDAPYDQEPYSDEAELDEVELGHETAALKNNGNAPPPSDEGCGVQCLLDVPTGGGWEGTGAGGGSGGVTCKDRCRWQYAFCSLRDRNYHPDLESFGWCEDEQELCLARCR